MELDPGRVVVRPYGWVFGFRPTGEPLTGGWMGVLFDRVNGDVLAIGAGHLAIEIFLVHYEPTIPPARLTMPPAFPPGVAHSRGAYGVIEPDEPIDPSRFPEELRLLHLMRPSQASRSSRDQPGGR
jgi:hypothetical protein